MNGKSYCKTADKLSVKATITGANWIFDLLLLELIKWHVALPLP